SVCRNKEGKKVRTKATAESAATNKAENHSHHSRRAICRRPNSACCARKESGPSRGEELELPSRRPSMDAMYFTKGRSLSRLGRSRKRRQRRNGTGLCESRT